MKLVQIISLCIDANKKRNVIDGLLIRLKLLRFEDGISNNKRMVEIYQA